jgi:hypothetical protein
MRGPNLPAAQATLTPRRPAPGAPAWGALGAVAPGAAAARAAPAPARQPRPASAAPRATRGARCRAAAASSTKQDPVCPPGSQPISTLSAGADFKAYFLTPYGDADAKRARGVVLFMHGFAQSPKAYYTLLRELAHDKGLLVVAPATDVYSSQAKQQGAMVERAKFFTHAIRDGKLPGLALGRDAAANAALLAHSVGAGLATHVAALAAADGAPFKAVVTLAPLTSVVDQYSPKAALEGAGGAPPLWPEGSAAPKFLVQYGLVDVLAPFWLARGLKAEYAKRFGDAAVSDVLYLGGTHVGFQDQVFVSDVDVDTEVLPWLNKLILLFALGLQGLAVLALLLLQELAPRVGVALQLRKDDEVRARRGGVYSLWNRTDQQPVCIFGSSDRMAKMHSTLALASSSRTHPSARPAGARRGGQRVRQPGDRRAVPQRVQRPARRGARGHRGAGVRDVRDVGALPRQRPPLAAPRADGRGGLYVRDGLPGDPAERVLRGPGAARAVQGARARRCMLRQAGRERALRAPLPGYLQPRACEPLRACP